MCSSNEHTAMEVWGTGMEPTHLADKGIFMKVEGKNRKSHMMRAEKISC